MTVTSYRLYCEECDRETVVRESETESTEWIVNSLYEHSGRCPWCNPNATPSEEAHDDSEPIEISLASLDAIGETSAQNLARAGYDTVEAVTEASDEEILDVAWVGDKALQSLRERAAELNKQIDTAS